MQINLSGKRAVVSGSTAGIGLAIAKGLAVARASVVVNGRTQARVDAAISAITATVPGAAIAGVAADLATSAGAKAFLAAAPDADILVNNLGLIDLKPFQDLTDDDWIRLFETNVMSGVRLSRHYLPQMVAKGWGRIVFISSESGLNIPPEMISYGTTKTAQLAVSRGLAESVAGSGVTVNAVLPGFTRSEAVANFLDELVANTGQTQEQVERELFKARPTSIIGRLASTDEVANMVVYICSEQASATTGAALRVDGGAVRFVA